MKKSKADAKAKQTKQGKKRTKRAAAAKASAVKKQSAVKKISRGRGRPKGSKNKPKHIDQDSCCLTGRKSVKPNSCCCGDDEEDEEEDDAAELALFESDGVDERNVEPQDEEEYDRWAEKQNDVSAEAECTKHECGFPKRGRRGKAAYLRALAKYAEESDIQSPGKVLMDLLIKHHISTVRLAGATGIPYNTIYRIIHNRRRINAVKAFRLGIFFGNGTHFWQNCQNQWDMFILVNSPRGKRILAEIKPFAIRTAQA